MAQRTRLTRIAPVAAIAAVTLVLAGCSSAASNDTAAPTPEPTTSMAAPSTEPVEIATDLDAPWEVVFYDDTPLISLRGTGDVLELLEDGSTRVIGTVPDVQSVNESGLLGMAVGPDGLLYVYSTSATDNRIERFTIDGEPGSLALGAEETVIDGLPANTYHDGGRIHFGPDGMLYASVGDTGNGRAAQDPDALNGKILRMTPDGDVPDGNPIDGSLVWSLGHRNVQGFGWATDGTMFAAEFGQDSWDELNLITPGANYGWPDVEGAGGGEGFTDPVQAWPTDAASPSGLAIVDDTIFIANLRGEVLRAVPVSDPASAREYYQGEYGRLRTAVIAPDGTLWVVTNNTDGRGTPQESDDRILSVDLTS